MKKAQTNGMGVVGLLLIIFGVLLFIYYGNFNIFDGIFNNSNKTNEPPEKESNLGGIKVANWNLQIYGDSKASNPSLIDFYQSKIKNYDIIFIQEIRDIDGSAFDVLCDGLNEYLCVISSRAGRSSSKEQYGIIYKKEIYLESLYDYNLNNQTIEIWERPPIEVTFNYNNKSIVFYNIHIKPDDVKQELDYLEKYRRFDLEDNVIFLGDFNADCNYYSPQTEPEFDRWYWVIQDYEDTTVSKTDCAYDRIIVSQPIKNMILNSGIDKEVTEEQSDHYLVWVELEW